MSLTTAISVTKSVSFRGVQQEFTNVYHYKTPLGPADAGEASGLIDQIVVIEKGIHSTDVTFVRARAWIDGGTKAENQMITQKNLSGTGSLTPATAMDRERAILIQFQAGVDSRGRPVKLRKWFHICGVFKNGTAASNAQLQNTQALDSATRTAQAAPIQGLKSLTQGVRNFDLCGPKGRDTTGDATTHQWLEHHQLGDMWR